ncbi:LAME_0H03884g1_1 [Lachancea meyersii CBS 8951]|uniref:LAME_0H03884g1_1 n=1 Tax=Lachancea meyersii CBS 8951 TaxID=1266667 RepID=A0A1G4KDR5_9SACH|nr:LAME_0H03884g1_1 [Lachancea meyersii CBS 8951]
MSRTVPFKQVDVFTSTPYKGNPVAIVNCWDLDESTIEQSTLQSIAVWTNLSETTFLFKPTNEKCDYKVRIFTPKAELEFAGHPTLGTCHAYLEFSGRKNVEKIYQECALGAVELTIKDKKLSFKGVKTDVVSISSDLTQEYTKCVTAPLVTEPILAEVGPHWVVALVEDNKTCFDMEIDYELMTKVAAKHGTTGMIIAGKFPDSEKYEMRAFAPAAGVVEDPVCGSGALALARYLQEVKKFDSSYEFEISQGGRLGRQGEIKAAITHSEGSIGYHIGGQCISVVNNGEFLI